MERSVDTALDQEVLNAQKRLREIKCREAVAKNEIRAIDRKLEKLVEERKNAVNVLSGPIASSIRDAITPYCKAWNLAFFTAMRDRLPRELRDMIYAQLWDSQSLQHYASHYMKQAVLSRCRGKTCSTNPLPNECEWHQHHPHFIKPALVGPEAARETVEAWFKALRGCDALMVQNLSHIERLFSVDAFFVGVKPADVLRQLDIRLDLERLIEPLGGGLKKDLSAVQRRIDGLMKIKKKAGFKLSIELLQRRIQLNLWEDVFVLFRPVLEAFEMNAANVRIYWTYSGLLDEVVRRELNELIKNPHPTWKPEMIVSLDMEPRIAERHRLYDEEDRSDFDPEDYSDSEDEYDEHPHSYDYDEWLEEEVQVRGHFPDSGGGCGCWRCNDDDPFLVQFYSDEDESMDELYADAE